MMMETVLITGANRGIGLSMAQQYHNRGYHVVAVCRTPGDELLTLDGVTIIDSVDFSNAQSIKLAVNNFPSKIDIFICNAGILTRVDMPHIHDHMPDIQQQFLVNACGPLLLVQSALHVLNPGAKVAMITSRMGSIADNDSGGHYGYRMSKAALNMAAKSLSIDLKPKGILVGVIHPGWVQTDMTGHTGHLTPDDSASAIIDRINELTIEDTGMFFHSNGDPLPW